MSLIDRWRHRFRALFRGEDARREREAEMAFHLSLEQMHGEHAGLAADDARVHARRQFGNATALMEDARGVSRSRWLDALAQDLRYAMRTLRRSPGYATGAALTLAIGIGTTTAVFSIFDTLVLRGLPYGDPFHLNTAFERNASGGLRTPSYPAFRDWLADSPTWKASIEGMSFVRGMPTWIDAPDGAERAIVANVSPGFFELMRTRPLLGRTFLPAEQTPGGERVVVLSHDAWRHYFGGDTGVLGRIVNIDSIPTRIIGVMPRGFIFPQWASGRAASSSMWTPIAHIEATDVTLAKRGDHADSRVVLRVRATSDSARASAALSVIEARLAVAYPAESKEWRHAGLFNERDAALGGVRQLVRTLAGAVALVLLLACVNVANLSFLRGAARARELAVRVALGAERGRVVRQLLTESLVVAGASAAGGTLLAALILAATRSLAANQLIGAQDLGINGPTLAFAVGASLVTAMLSAIVPAFRATRVAPVAAVRGSAHASTGGRHDARIRGALVIVQLALAVVLLIGTGLLVRSFRNASNAPQAFDPVGLVETRITPPAKYATAQDALGLYQALLERVRAIPGVVDAAYTNNGRMPTTVAAEGGSLRNDIGSTIAPHYHTVSETYLRTMKMSLAAGQWLTADDMRTRDHFVVNEALAHQLFPNQNALGHRITALRAARERPEFGQPVTGTIVGIVRDVPQRTGSAPPQADLYVPYTLDTWVWGTLYVRTTDVARTIPLVRTAIRDVDPAIPEARASSGFNGVGATMARINSGFAQRRLVLAAISAFALSALLLAAIGLYSVISYGVSQRTREVGVRIALGATRTSILRLVFGEGAWLVTLGVITGCAGALGATRLIRTMLVGTTTTDTATYVVTATVLIATAMLACYLPARRAAGLSPTEAIRGG
jgi:predicted permease